MATGETAGEDKKQRERGKRLWSNYRWTLDMYNRLLVLQNGVCAVCGRAPKPGGMNLVVDHYHPKVIAVRASNSDRDHKWLAHTTFPDGQEFWGYGVTKAKSIEVVKNQALPASVRGLLCPGRHGKAGHGVCNRLLGRVDNIPWLRSVILYLENPPAKQIVLDSLPKI